MFEKKMLSWTYLYITEFDSTGKSRGERRTLTLVRPGYRQSAHAVPVLCLVAVCVLQHLAVTRPHDFTDRFTLHYALESGSLAANYSYVF